MNQLHELLGREQFLIVDSHEHVVPLDSRLRGRRIGRNVFDQQTFALGNRQMRSQRRRDVFDANAQKGTIMTLYSIFLLCRVVLARCGRCRVPAPGFPGQTGMRNATPAASPRAAIKSFVVMKSLLLNTKNVDHAQPADPSSFD